MNLHDRLLKTASNQELGHFYIVETSAPPHEAHDNLLSFIHGFIRDYYQKVEGHKQSLEHLMDHPDVYVLGNLADEEDEKKDKFFKVEDAEALARFFEFRPVQGKRKFAVITEGHRINTTVANKWLKLFEEPQGTSTIFLLNPRRQQLLPTIHSRAIHLRLSKVAEVQDFSEWNSFLEDLKKMSLAQFLENYSRGERDLAFWVNETIRWESEQEDMPKSKDNLAQWIKNFQEMETFHQPNATKWSLFYSFIQENVLKR
jgi:DNA polymerase III delta prime subunit